PTAPTLRSRSAALPGGLEPLAHPEGAASGTLLGTPPERGRSDVGEDPPPGHAVELAGEHGLAPVDDGLERDEPAAGRAVPRGAPAAGRGIGEPHRHPPLA